ncbi:MAG TPA: Rrf2 family transcriptional regulator [Caulobacteraceae bacterium]|jgi:Rrf2 family iron-sulfur cluster assembly transcriptional regulator
MRLSTKGRYAVMALVDLAREGASGPVTLAEIAARQAISLSYLEQLFARLRRKGLVQSARGPGGGYRLARPAAEVAIAEVVLAVDEPLKVTRCPAGSRGCMPGGEQCLTHHLWEELGRQIYGYLAGVTLADVAAGRVRRTLPAEAA